MNIYDYLVRAAGVDPQGVAVCLGDQLHQTWSTLDDRSRRLARSLAVKGQAGDRVLIASPNCAEFPEIMFGTWAAGMAVVPINAKLHVREIAEIIADSEPVAVLVSAKIAEGLQSIGEAAIEIGSEEYEVLFADTGASPVARGKDDLAWLFYTSGTTGRSKGAMLTHGNLAAMTDAHLADIDSPEGASALLHAAPMSHGSGLYMLPYVARGSRQVIPASGGFDPAEFCELCVMHEGVRAFLAPTMVQRLRLAQDDQTPFPTNLELVVYGGGPMHVSDMRAALAAFGPIFAQIYGQGETPMTITGLTREDHIDASDTVLGSVGKVRSVIELKIVGDSGERMPAGTPGEILCRGATVMAGYWHNPDATKATLADGWLHTGDIGTLDENGFLTLLDRSKDVVISGGSNIYPREVEEVLLAHPDVVEAAVIGSPDEEWGEIVVAHVVLSTDIPHTDLDGHCLAHIARFKRPKRYVVHEELPKNANGKVLKRELREV
ncbi:AMP-binding protein [Erythrobacter alti]|uniref:AMP-binding protein n=1 Tax=Erythrobacter alti TaxID=1896145 RepID=UPI0030F48064